MPYLASKLPSFYPFLLHEIRVPWESHLASEFDRLFAFSPWFIATNWFAENLWENCFLNWQSLKDTTNHCVFWWWAIFWLFYGCNGMQNRTYFRWFVLLCKKFHIMVCVCALVEEHKYNYRHIIVHISHLQAFNFQKWCRFDNILQGHHTKTTRRYWHCAKNMIKNYGTGCTIKKCQKSLLIFERILGFFGK